MVSLTTSASTRSRALRAALLLAAFASAGCGAGVVGQQGVGAERGAAVVSGMPTHDYPAVVRLLLRQYGALVGACSGTVVGHRTVLTASHCLVDEDGYRREAEVLFDGEPVPTEGTAHPGYGGGAPGNDIAVLRLPRSAPVAPMQVASKAPALFSKLTLVGFGMTDWDDRSSSGYKHEGEDTLVLRTARLLHTLGRQPGCYGDSGGAALGRVDDEPVLAGVLTGGLKILRPHTWHVRLDAHLDWVRQQARGDVFVVGEAPPPAPPEEEPPTAPWPEEPEPPRQEAPPRASQVAFIAPQDGAALPPTFRVLAYAAPPRRPVAMWIEVDGTRATDDSALLDELTLTLEPGPHELKLVAHYAEGDRAEAAISVTVVDEQLAPPPAPAPGEEDRNPPQVTILAPTAGTVVPARTTVRAEISDESGVATVIVLCDDEMIGALDGAPYQIAVTLPATCQQLSVVAYDPAGNRGIAAVPIAVQGYERGGGCGVLPVAPISAPLWLLALLGLAAIRGRGAWR